MLTKNFVLNITACLSGLSFSFDELILETNSLFEKEGVLFFLFVFMGEQELKQFKSAINCKWQDAEEKKDVAHYQRIIKKGLCPSLNIRYETYLDLNGYEVRWKK